MIFDAKPDLDADPIANPAGESKSGALTNDFPPQRNSLNYALALHLDDLLLALDMHEPIRESVDDESEGKINQERREHSSGQCELGCCGAFVRMVPDLLDHSTSLTLCR